MSETKTGVKIPVGWLRLERGVTTLPGDWYWDGLNWMPVCRRKSVSDSPMVIRRCRYRVGERVVVWKPSGYSPELEGGLATIRRVYASDHRGVQSVSLLPTGQPSRDSSLNSYNSDALAPVVPIWSDFGSVPDEWMAEDIIDKIDPTNDPNVAPYLASETIHEALQQAELAEEPQADSEYRHPHPGDCGKRVEVRDSLDTSSDESRWVERTLIAVIAVPLDQDVGTFVAAVDGCDNTHICHLWRHARIKIKHPKPQPDHIADANKMVEMPVVEQSLTTPKPMTLYIAGPMRGIAWFNYPMFDRIAKQLRDQGCEVISPADEDRKQDGFDPFENPDYANPESCRFPSEMDFHRTVRRCLEAVLQCEEIVLLPGWERSSGAVAELTLAMWLNKRVRHVLIDEADQVRFFCFLKGLESLANDLCDEYFPEGDEPGDPIDVDEEDETADDILEEALSITRGSRSASYGPPDQDFRRTAGMWSALFGAKLKEGVTFEPRDVALAMILLKTSREMHQRKRDNWVDIAGYARCGSLCN